MNANVRTIGGSIWRSGHEQHRDLGLRAGSFPRESGYHPRLCAVNRRRRRRDDRGLFVPGRLRPPTSVTEATLPHAELGMVAGGTLVGDESE